VLNNLYPISFYHSDSISKRFLWTKQQLHNNFHWKKCTEMHCWQPCKQLKVDPPGLTKLQIHSLAAFSWFLCYPYQSNTCSFNNTVWFLVSLQLQKCHNPDISAPKLPWSQLPLQPQLPEHCDVTDDVITTAMRSMPCLLSLTGELFKSGIVERSLFKLGIVERKKYHMGWSQWFSMWITASHGI